jgi:hypothetical protein
VEGDRSGRRRSSTSSRSGRRRHEVDARSARTARASYSFDSSSLPDGEYVFRVTASDADANPGEGKTASRDVSRCGSTTRRRPCARLAAAGLRRDRGGRRGVADPRGGLQRRREEVDPDRAEGRAVRLAARDLPHRSSGRRARRVRASESGVARTSPLRSRRMRAGHVARTVLSRRHDALRPAQLRPAAGRSRIPHNFAAARARSSRRLLRSVRRAGGSRRRHPVDSRARSDRGGAPSRARLHRRVARAGRGEGGTLVRRLTGEPATLDPILQSTGAEAEVLQYVARNLFDFDAALHLVPGLAQRTGGLAPTASTTPSVSRPEAVWEDGSPSRRATPSSRSAASWTRRSRRPVFKPLFEDCTGVTVVDDDLPRAFREPYAFRRWRSSCRSFRSAATRGGVPTRRRRRGGPVRRPLPRRLLERAAVDRPRAQPPSWGEPRPLRPDRVSHRAGQPTAYRLLASGDLDERRPRLLAEEARRVGPGVRACCRTVEFYNLDYNYIALNSRSPFFADARVRRAVTMLLDRAAIVRGLYPARRASSRAVGAGLAGLRRRRRAAAVRTRGGGAAARRGGLARHGRRRPPDRAGRAFEFDLLVSRDPRSAGRSTRCSPPSSRASA